MTGDARASSGIVVVVNGEHMGHGDDALGAMLMIKFLATLTTVDPKPDTLVFYNAAVRLLTAESASLGALKELEETGAQMLACVTCLEFYELVDQLAVGKVSNMREIVQHLMNAQKVVAI